MLEKEAMAVTERFPLFLKGKEFVWQTDHQPLEKLFHEDLPLRLLESTDGQEIYKHIDIQ